MPDAKLNDLFYLNWLIYFRQEHLVALIDDLTQDVADESTVIDSAVQLLDNLSAQLAAAGTDPAKLAQLKSTIDANKQRLADAVQANTPAATTTPPTPTPAP
jgi:enamine deaminase RidA (YjgF/YER057c/UK114 family)